MKIIEIDDDQLVELSEDIPISLRCDKCGTKEEHKPISQVGRGSEMDEGWVKFKDKMYHIVVPDVEDAYIVECIKCGNIVMARWYGYQTISPDDVLDL